MIYLCVRLFFFFFTHLIIILNRLVRFKEERMNEMFPDELDTPIDIPARTRFQKYA